MEKSKHKNYPIIRLEQTCFADLTKEQVAELSEHRRQVLFEAGEDILKQGGLGTTVLFLLDGYVKEYITSIHGKQTNLRVAVPGDFIALSSLFNPDRVNQYSVKAIKDVTLCVFERDYLLKLIKENSKVAFRLIQRYSEMENYFFSLFAGHLYGQMHGKMARTLLYIDEISNPEDSIFNYLSRIELGEFAAINPSNTSRVLKSFEADGIIKLQERCISILDRKRLIQIAELG